jgi:hypothetical protein
MKRDLRPSLRNDFGRSCFFVWDLRRTEARPQQASTHIWSDLIFPWGSGESLLGNQHVKTWASVTLVPISTLLRACMSVVNLYVSCIVSHHLFTITYIIRVTNIINIAQTILKCQYRIFNNRQICRQSYINLILWAQQTLKQEMGSCWSSCWSRSSPHLRRWFCYLNGVL